jgi:hypothetical protein
MVVNFIEHNTLNWILIREERTTKNGGFGGTTYTSPHVILDRSLNIYDRVSVDRGTETKRYSPGIYRAQR